MTFVKHVTGQVASVAQLDQLKRIRFAKRRYDDRDWCDYVFDTVGAVIRVDSELTEAQAQKLIDVFNGYQPEEEK